MSDVVSVLLIGDQAVDQLVLRQPRVSGDTEYDWQRHSRYWLWELPGGVALSEMVLTSLGFATRSLPISIHGQTLKTLSRLAVAKVDDAGHSKGLLSNDQDAEPDRTGKKPLHLRVLHAEGYFRAPSGQVEPQEPPEGTFPIVFLNDAGCAMRRSVLACDRVRRACTSETILLHKMHLPLKAGTPIHDAVAQSGAGRKILVVSASDLRADGLRLRASLSWDMFLEDLRAAFKDGFLAEAAQQYSHVAILVGEDGVFALEVASKTLLMAYDAGAAEGDHDARYPGDVYGKTNVFTCALVASLQEEGSRTLTTTALARALNTMRDYSSRCLTVTALDSRIEPRLPPVTALSSPDNLRRRQEALSDQAPQPTFNETLAKAREIVRFGASRLRDMDHVRIGDFYTVDKFEIEGFRAIKTIIDGYVDAPNQKKPLSLAVFGPPGSGKSFGIKQLAKSRAEIEFREYNLSEASVEALPGYFHEMRDVNLQGKIPLWFFDEFDSRGCELVSRFLAPMQDAKVRDGHRIHPIGRGILVFAGGTAATAANFMRDTDEARRLKIPDFVSRLAGIIDIRGINPVEDTKGQGPDINYLLRRAVVLRSQLEQHRKDIAGPGPDELCIEDGLLDALLRTESYTHGARSMEKIIQAGALRGPRPIFGGSDLPDRGLLALHLRKPEQLLTPDLDRQDPR